MGYCRSGEIQNNYNFLFPRSTGYTTRVRRHRQADVCIHSQLGSSNSNGTLKLPRCYFLRDSTTDCKELDANIFCPFPFQHADVNVNKILIGNKCDMHEQRVSDFRSLTCLCDTVYLYVALISWGKNYSCL